MEKTQEYSLHAKYPHGLTQCIGYSLLLKRFPKTDGSGNCKRRSKKLILSYKNTPINLCRDKRKYTISVLTGVFLKKAIKYLFSSRQINPDIHLSLWVSGEVRMKSKAILRSKLSCKLWKRSRTSNTRWPYVTLYTTAASGRFIYEWMCRGAVSCRE